MGPGKSNAVFMRSSPQFNESNREKFGRPCFRRSWTFTGRWLWLKPSSVRVISWFLFAATDCVMTETAGILTLNNTHTQWTHSIQKLIQKKHLTIQILVYGDMYSLFRNMSDFWSTTFFFFNLLRWLMFWLIEQVP